MTTMKKIGLPMGMLVAVLMTFSFKTVPSSSQVLQGIQNTITVQTATFRKDFKILTEERYAYDFGQGCYFAGTNPIGRTAIDNLTKANKITLIKSVLDGNNDEGKVYAIVALLVMNQQGKCTLTPQDKSKIKKIIASDLPINRCQGCLVSSTKTSELFQEKDYQALLQGIE